MSVNDTTNPERVAMRSSMLRALELIVTCAPDLNLQAALEVLEHDIKAWRESPVKETVQ